MTVIEIDTSELRTALKTILEFMEEIPGIIDDGKLKLCGMDIMGVVLCTEHIPCTIKEYVKKNEERFIVQARKLYDAIDKAKEEKITLIFGDHIDGVFGKVKFRVPLYDIMTTKRIPKAFPNAGATYPSTNRIVITKPDFLKFVGDIKLSDTLAIHFIADRGNIGVVCGDEIERCEYWMTKDEDFLSSLEGNDDAIYPFDIIKRMAKRLSSSEMVICEFAYGYPIVFTTRDNGTEQSILIAPRVTND